MGLGPNFCLLCLLHTLQCLPADHYQQVGWLGGNFGWPPTCKMQNANHTLLPKGFDLVFLFSYPYMEKCQQNATRMFLSNPLTICNALSCQEEDIENIWTFDGENDVDGLKAICEYSAQVFVLKIPLKTLARPPLFIWSSYNGKCQGYHLCLIIVTRYQINIL